MSRGAVLGLALVLFGCGSAAPPVQRAVAPTMNAAPAPPNAPIADEDDDRPDEAPAPRSGAAASRAHAADLRARRGDAAYSPPARTKASACATRGALPDPACTPGAVMTDSLEVICHESTTHRRLVPADVRRAVLASYGLPVSPGIPLEVDHLIPLELGGDNAIENLWPEPEGPGDGFRQKDRVEHYLHREVCRGAMSLRDAQRVIATDWRSVLGEMGAGAVGDR